MHGMQGEHELVRLVRPGRKTFDLATFKEGVGPSIAMLYPTQPRPSPRERLESRSIYMTLVCS